MAAVILKVLEYRREEINGTLMDKYKMLLKDGTSVYESIGIRHAFPLVLEAGQLLENMRAVGELSGAEFAKELYEAKDIEERKVKSQEERMKVDDIHKITKKAEVAIKDRVMKPVVYVPEQLSLF